jgi:hypothetical protein
MLANVFSNTTPPRVERAESVPLLGSRSAYALWPPLRLWPSSPARHFNNPPACGLAGSFNRIRVDQNSAGR